MNNFKDLIQYFNSINIEIEDVTSDFERDNLQKVVIVTYDFNGTKFTTKKLYYKEISKAPAVKNPEHIEKFFGNKVYWLDIDIHKWPQSSGETDINDLIINDITKDDEFKNELLKLANNAGNGAIQLISKQGRSNQYYRNLENNNHWHDIILLIKAIIEDKPNFDNYLMPLVFRWDGNKHTDRLRVSLSPHFGARALLYHLINNVNNKKSAVLKELIMQEYIELLEYKKQIILQGPPGTGKTKLAKELANAIVKTDRNDLEYDLDQIQLVQFHPSYTYEDFIRGIVIQPNEKGDGLLYEPENKIFGNIIELAKQNIIDSKKDIGTISKENWVYMNFDNFVKEIQSEIITNLRMPITEKVDITGVEQNAFRYKGKKGWTKLGNRMLFDDLVQAYLDENKTRQDIKKNLNLSGLANWHATYYIKVLDSFRTYLETNKLLFTKEVNAQCEIEKIDAKKYVLIIDEINRANLSSVLGELIYALEYRGEKISGMYAIDGNHEIQVPENLYIIGTMNTADRSVSQIDYAIRRRFAFVDVLPEDLSNDDNVSFDSGLFDKVRVLFKNDDGTHSEHLSEEFKPEEVQLGHSYFIKKDEDGGTMDIRLRYEIKPILKEYVKDGILKQSALAEIEKLSC